MATAASHYAQWVAPGRQRRARTTPEIYFNKQIDNSRLVKVRDAQRTREMAMFGMALACLLAVAMLYTWQHFSAIEYGYRIEEQKAQREQLGELNRALRLEEASLRDPERIDYLARQMGLQSTAPGQVQRIDAPQAAGGSVLASNGIAVVAASY